MCGHLHCPHMLCVEPRGGGGVVVCSGAGVVGLGRPRWAEALAARARRVLVRSMVGRRPGAGCEKRSRCRRSGWSLVIYVASKARGGPVER